MKRNSWRWIAVGVLGSAILAYSGILTWFKANENGLLYFPEKNFETSPEMFGAAYGKVQISSTDSVKLVCWIIPSADTSTLWLLYFHGNAGNIAKRGYVEHYAQLRKLGLNILTVDYRGYGESSGNPSEGGIYDDARAAYEYLRSMQHVPPKNIIVYGYSLGSAVAVDLTSKVPVAAIILEGSFPTITEVGQEHYPFLPVQLMASSHFSSKEKIARVDVPKLFIHARDDRTIPIQFGRELFELAPEPKTFLEVRGDHNTAHAADAELFYNGIRLFLMQVQARNRMPAPAGEQQTVEPAAK
jgi:fermentation-respiration switch protein FrsA (DUF1100 family)